MSIDDDLDRLLQRAFDEARPTGHEDVRGLREGAVAKAHGLRRRRRIGTAAVSTVATTALVAGIGSLAAGGWLGVGSGSTVSSAARPSSGATLEKLPGSPEPTYALAAFIPDQNSLPKGLTYADEVAEGPDGPAVTGLQICDGRGVADTTGLDVAPRPVRYAHRLALSTGNVSEISANVTVTGWAKGTGAQRFADLQDNTMACRFLGQHERLTWPARDTDSTWLSVHRNGDFIEYLAAQRVGDVIVAVGMDLRDREESSKENAIRLCDEVAAKLRASSLAAAKGR